ncbi:unnamed protein product [Cuscuta campestris]|uniref:Integrase catalytic domain-containing protein n=1 Tax=Cuscuta campestris TaxID=132261 RepID=A0A484M1U8_9ASTE|nr:unnamed protein product [Cuscuta campestris]
MAGRRTRRNPATSAQSTVRSDNPEQGMIVPVNGLETALNNVANMMANIMERLDKALPGPSGTRDIPAGQPRQVLRTASSPILQELHDPEEVERERRAIDRRRAEELARNNRVNEGQAKDPSRIFGDGHENPRGSVFERISRQKAHVSERLGKNPEKAPQGWIRPQASQVASSNREPRKRNDRGASQVPVRSLRNLEEDEVQSQARVPAPRRLGPPVPEAGEFQDLRQQIQEMQRKINKGRVFTTRTNTPLAPEIFAEPYPQGFKMPFVKRYDGESDPQEHINSYVQVMIAVDASDALMCRCFLQTVDSKVADWVNHIPAGSIRTWDELALRFLEHFAGNCRPKKHFTHLASVRQKHGESLKNFLIRWRKESREVEGTDDKSMLAMFTAALQDGLLHTDLTTHPPDTFEEAMVRAGRYVTLEERKEEKKEKTPKEEEKTGNKKPFKNKKQGFPDGPKGASPGTSEKHKSANPVFTLPVTEVMAHAAQQGLMTYPTYSQKVCNVEDTGKWCAYHRKNDHNTEDCYTLKNEMARLIRRGHLKKFVQDGDTGNPGNAQNGKRRDKWPKLRPGRNATLGLKTKRRIRNPHRIARRDTMGVISSLEGILVETRPLAGRSGLTRQWSTRGSQKVSRAWYLKATKQPVKYDTQVGEVTAQLLRAEEKRPRVEVAGDIEEVELEPGTPGRFVRIGRGLGAELRSRVISVLRRFRRVFAWSPADMPGLDHKIAVHRLNVLPDAKPVKQKRRHLSQERRDFVKKETLRDAELRYSRLEKAMLAVFWTAKRLTPYFQAHRIIVLTNEPLASLTRSPAASARMTKWAVFISQYNVEFRPHPSIKGQALADFQVECTAREVTRAQAETRVEKDWWIMSIDGSSGSRSCRAGIVLITPEKFRIYYAIRFQFRVSNNEAEYEALINGLKILHKMGVSRVQVYTDSRLVVGQITGEFEAKEERMKRYRDMTLAVLGKFEFKLEHIPRAQNAEADVLSKLSVESPEYISKIATIEELVTPSLNSSEVIWVSADPPEWLDRLAIYIEDGESPEDPQEARLLRMRAPTYKIQDGVLYKRSYNGVLLRCLRATEAKALMEEIHEEVCAAHQGPYSISRRAIIQGYFWPTMRKDCEEYVRKCSTCQQFQNIPGRPATNYTPISSVTPFSRWGIDLVGALPKGVGQARWIVVAIDYFTKWVEAEPLAGITGRQMIDFVGTNILCRFGVPKQIISDNGTQFEEAEFQDFLKTWGIQHTKVSVAYPQANGQQENVNRTIIDGIKKKLLSEGSKWVDELPRILWTYKTTLRRATGDTPFGLAYGFEARAPAEVVIPTMREMEFDPEENEQNQVVELNFVEERRDEARIRAENYRRQVKSYFDSKVKPRAFQVGDYVMRKREKSQPTKGGKLAKKYEGPYIIKAVVRPGTYKLVTPKGKEIDRTWNVEHLVKFSQ